MRVERVYDWKRGHGLSERDPGHFDPNLRSDQVVRIGHVSDSHVGKGVPGRRLGALRRWLEAMEGLGVDAIVHSGDLVESPADEEVLEATFEMLEQVDTPLLGVPGNHDVIRPAQSSKVTDRWGPYPRCEHLEGVQFYLLDSMAWPPVEDRSEGERESARQSGFFSRGALGPAQRGQLAELFADHPPGPRVLVVHHHLRQPVPAKPWYEDNDDLMAPLEDVDELTELARREGVEIFLHGHRHQYVAPYAPFENSVILGGPSATATGVQRARMIDISRSGGACRIWELVRYE